MIITIGVDIGQRVDPTAIVVSELDWRPIPPEAILPDGPRYEDHHIIRYLESLPLGTEYHEVRDRIRSVRTQVENIVTAGNLRNKAGWLIPEDYAELHMYVDATGVGQPVVDMLAEAGVPCTGVYFTYGDKRAEVVDEFSGKLRVHLGKGYMVSRLQALLQTGRIHLPELGIARLLAQELLDYEIRVSDRANEQMGAFRVGAHDDLVTALGLSCNKPPRQMGAMASTVGHIPMQVPEWAGGPGAERSHSFTDGQQQQQPRLPVPYHHTGLKGLGGGLGGQDWLDQLRSRTRGH